jgi:peptide/nickel transport system permease protein
MRAYLIKRLGTNIFVFFGITILVYFLSTMAPGSPEQQYLSLDATTEDIAKVRSQLGLDQPVYIQYLKWSLRMFHGDLGYSFRSGTQVIPLISGALKGTLLTGALSLGFALLVAVPLGIFFACKPHLKINVIVSGFFYAGSAIPNFFIGMVLIYIFSVRLKIMPASGMHSSAWDTSIGDMLWHLALPILVISANITGILLKQVRESMLEVFNEEFVKMARAKGLSEARVILGYVIRNAIIPIVTTIGLTIPSLLSGSIFAETLFSLPGIGKLMMTSILSRDYPVIMGLAVFIALVVLALNFALDILYGYLDPRIRYGKL